MDIMTRHISLITAYEIVGDLMMGDFGADLEMSVCNFVPEIQLNASCAREYIYFEIVSANEADSGTRVQFRLKLRLAFLEFDGSEPCRHIFFSPIVIVKACQHEGVWYPPYFCVNDVDISFKNILKLKS